MEIRILKPTDVSENYVDWFSNKEVVKYSDNQYRLFSLEGQKLYVENCLKNKEIRLFGIFVEERHIGNIVGRVDVEEILGSIFENFCIGK